MKKLMIVIFIFIFSLVGCQSDKQLDQPENIKFDGVLVWDEVEEASSYRLKVNDEEYVLEIPYFDGLINEGTYDIEVQAIASGKWLDSNVSTYTLTIDYHQDATISFSRQGNMISWNDVDQAIGYLIIYNNQFQTVQSSSFEINPNVDESISVQAVFPDGSKTQVFSYAS